MKKTFSLVLLLTLLIIVVIFTLQNAVKIDIGFLFWNLEISLAILIFVLFAIGVIVGVFTLIPTVFQLKNEVRKKQKNINQVQKAITEAPEKEISSSQ